MYDINEVFIPITENHTSFIFIGCTIDFSEGCGDIYTRVLGEKLLYKLPV